MNVIGLTGGIASGKSTASNYLSAKGFVIIDADQIARQIMAVGKPAYKEVRAYFGPDFFEDDGSLDRRALGAYVFANSEELNRLNAMTHPYILDEIKSQLAKYHCQSDDKWVILDAALFFELHLEVLVKEVWYIDVTESVQRSRMIARDGLTAEQAIERIRAQWDSETKRRLADVIIDNDGTLETLYQQLDRCIATRCLTGGISG